MRLMPCAAIKEAFMINIGLIGYGYWGPNLARNFRNNPEFNLKTICDFSKTV